ncbi:MAG TPA: aspartyl protease family protein [Candidatus Elarobacter sp.]|jgi:hypothetical protein|nr:aspartyl protease family protein [Candidatus Elarobacter sp.]
MNVSSASRSAAAFVIALVLASALPTVAQPAGPSVDAVLSASAAALGIAALPRIRTLHQRGTITIAGVPGTAEGWIDVRNGTFSQFASAGPVGGAQGFDGTHVWNEDAAGVVWDDGSKPGLIAAIDGVYLNRYLLWLPGRGGATVTSLGTKTDGGRSYDALQVTPPGSVPFELWFDAVTHLPVRMIAKVGITTSITTFGDYRSVDGLQQSYTQTSDNDGNISTVNISSIVANDAGADAALRRPVEHVTDFSLPSGTTTIPFELVDNHVALPVTIDGKGPFRFLFDTGGANIIDADVAKQLGLGAAGGGAGSGVGAQTEAVQFATVDTLGVGAATLRKQGFVIAPVHAGFGMSSGKPVDGLIGFEVLARFVTTFDYGTQTVVLRTPESAAPVTAGKTVPFVFNGQHPMVDCAIDAIPGQCVLDTGSRISLTALSPFLAAHPAVVPANAAAIGANGFGVGGASLGRLARTTLDVAGYTIPDVITDLSTQTAGAFADPYYIGNIGAGTLRRFAVTFDYHRQTVAFVPNASFAVRETYDRSGTFLVAQGGKILVADVRPGTPAAKAGLARGDAIVTVDGKDAATLGLAALRDTFRGAPGTTHELGIVRAGAPKTVSLTLADYV